MNAAGWRLTLAAAALMGLSLGGRNAFGLFVSPLNTATNLGLATLSLMFAFGQLGIGLVQPWVGGLADRHGATRVIVTGAALLMVSTAALAIWPTTGTLVAVALVVSTIASCAVGSNGLLVGEVGRAVAPQHMGLAVGLVGAGASVGQLLLGPATQWVIGRFGWVDALWATAWLSLIAWPLALAFRRPAAGKAAKAGGRAAAATGQTLAEAVREWRFWRVALSFGVCGFHIGFLAVHMPGVIERCGLPPSLAGTWIAVAGAANIAGSVLMGLAMRRHDAAHLLALMYALRALGIAAMLLMPVSEPGLLGFALLMGATHMATLPPTTQLISRQHGLAHLGALFGVVMLVHQSGSFLGIAAGGWLAERTGSDTPLWLMDIALALLAAALVWPGWRQRGAAWAWAR